MKTKTKKRCGPETPPRRERECVPCGFEPPCRNAYFTGKLLTERDLTQEQRFFLDKLRQHNLRLHGWGVVCGLKVKPHEHCPHMRLVIEPGMAIDGCGRDILVPCDVEIPLPAPKKPPDDADACPPEHGEPARKCGCDDAEQAAHEQRPRPEEHGPPGPKPCPPRGELYVCLRYVEWETEPMPAPFDECACNGTAKRPNRICEGYRLEVLTEPPPGWPDRPHCRPPGDCADLYKRILEPCPQPGPPTCVPLAIIRDYVPGEPITCKMIDNQGPRTLLPSTRLLDDLIRCIMDKLPTQELTKITDVNWDHGDKYSCNQFEKEFLGDSAENAFRVTFSDKVVAGGRRPTDMPRNLFQALVVRHEHTEGDYRPGGYLEVAPARTWLHESGRHCYLKLAPRWAEHCLLHKKSFDLFLILRCNLLVDERGRPVDGNLLAERDEDKNHDLAWPTGDGIPGGTFESWIRVTA